MLLLILADIFGHFIILNIQIHLMLLLILKKKAINLTLKIYSNTSYVIINPNNLLASSNLAGNSNTSYVIINQIYNCHSQKFCSYSNTSYVIINHIKDGLSINEAKDSNTSYVIINRIQLRPHQF